MTTNNANPSSESAHASAGASSPPAKRSRRPVVVGSAFVLLCAYSILIEPNWVEATHHTVRAPQGIHLVAPLKIAHLTDLHTAGLGYRERSLLAILEAEKPDVIVITGDSVANHKPFEDTVPLMSRLRAPLGVFLVRGNWEEWRPRPVASRQYSDAGVRLLWNEGAAPRPDVWIAGVDDPQGGDPRMDRAMAKAPPGVLRIGLFHRPLYFDEVSKMLHLAFAGHSHGGQVRIPFLPALWVPGGVGRYVDGWFEKDGARMYVSRGIGTSLAPLRFACRPEVAFVTVTSAE